MLIAALKSNMARNVCERRDLLPCEGKCNPHEDRAFESFSLITMPFRVKRRGIAVQKLPNLGGERGLAEDLQNGYGEPRSQGEGAEMYAASSMGQNQWAMPMGFHFWGRCSLF